MQSPRFDIATQRDAFLAHLDEHGYAVVAEAADAAAVRRGDELLWDFLESIPNTKVRRGDIGTWGFSGDWLPSETNGIINGFGFGQSQFMWHLRLLPRVRQTFSAIWKTNDLIVSFDGGNVFRPWRHNPKWLTDGGWYHVDQNAMRANRRGRVCVQGLVTLCDVTEDTGGLVVVPGSHKQHTALCKRVKISRAVGDFLPVPRDDPLLAAGTALLVCAKAGDLVVWDSRTIHCNTPALTALGCKNEAALYNLCRQQTPEQEQAKSLSPLPMAEQHLEEAEVEAKMQHTRGGIPAHGQVTLLRQVGYVCMTPARAASEEVLAKRRQAFVDGISTSHWPHAFVMAGVALPDAPKNNPDIISPMQRALIGYDRPKTSRCALM